MVLLSTFTSSFERKGKARSIEEFERQIRMRHTSEGVELVDNKPYVLDFGRINRDFIRPFFISISRRSPVKVTNVSERNHRIVEYSTGCKFTICSPVCMQLGLSWANTRPPDSNTIEYEQSDKTAQTKEKIQHPICHCFTNVAKCCMLNPTSRVNHLDVFSKADPHHRGRLANLEDLENRR